MWKRSRSICFATVVFSLLFVQRMEAIAPHVIMLRDDSSTLPTFVTEPQDLFRFMCVLDGEGAVPGDMGGRRFVSLSAFWGPPWVNYRANAGWRTEIRADQAGQHGRFYPAVQDGGPIFVGTPMKVESTAVPTDLKGFAFAHALSPECASVFKQYMTDSQEK